MSSERTIKELEELFETPFEEALELANNHQNFDDLINFLEGGIGTQFATGNVEGVSDVELRRVIIKLCKTHRRDDSFHPTTGRLFLKECEKRAIKLPPDVRNWLRYLVAWENVLNGNALFDKQMSLRRALKRSTENSRVEEDSFERLSKQTPKRRLEDVSQSRAVREEKRHKGTI